MAKGKKTSGGPPPKKGKAPPGTEPGDIKFFVSPGVPTPPVPTPAPPPPGTEPGDVKFFNQPKVPSLIPPEIPELDLSLPSPVTGLTFTALARTGRGVDSVARGLEIPPALGQLLPPGLRQALGLQGGRLGGRVSTRQPRAVSAGPAPQVGGRGTVPGAPAISGATGLNTGAFTQRFTGPGLEGFEAEDALRRSHIRSLFGGGEFDLSTPFGGSALIQILANRGITVPPGASLSELAQILQAVALDPSLPPLSERWLNALEDARLIEKVQPFVTPNLVGFPSVAGGGAGRGGGRGGGRFSFPASTLGLVSWRI